MWAFLHCGFKPGSFSCCSTKQVAHLSYFILPPVILSGAHFSCNLWISMKERRICFNKSEIVKFSDDRVDRMDRSRMPVVSQRMVWLHQRTPLQMCFALTHYTLHWSALQGIAVEMCFALTHEMLHWNCSGKSPERRSRDCLPSYHHPLQYHQPLRHCHCCTGCLLLLLLVILIILNWHTCVLLTIGA